MPLTIFFVLFAIPAALIFPIIGLVKRKKDGEAVRGISKAIACLCFVGFWFLAAGASESIRHRSFVAASYVGDRIVHALSEYRDKNGEYPTQLGQLVPGYLDAMPYTGMIGYPEFSYDKDHNDLETKPGEYELRIDCTSGALNWDRFIYWPSEKYPDRIQGNGVERIRAWAYVHE
jgi:hypothetical protein